MKELFFVSLECPETFDSEMDLSMTHTADSNEIRFYIASQLAAQLCMMKLKIFGTSALLALPAITPEHSLTKPPIGIPIQADSGLSCER